MAHHRIFIVLFVVFVGCDFSVPSSDHFVCTGSCQTSESGEVNSKKDVIVGCDVSSFDAKNIDSAYDTITSADPLLVVELAEGSVQETVDIKPNADNVVVLRFNVKAMKSDVVIDTFEFKFYGWGLITGVASVEFITGNGISLGVKKIDKQDFSFTNHVVIPAHTCEQFTLKASFSMSPTMWWTYGFRLTNVVVKEGKTVNGLPLIGSWFRGK